MSPPLPWVQRVLLLLGPYMSGTCKGDVDTSLSISRRLIKHISQKIVGGVSITPNPSPFKFYFIFTITILSSFRKLYRRFLSFRSMKNLLSSLPPYKIPVNASEYLLQHSNITFDIFPLGDFFNTQIFLQSLDSLIIF